MKKGLLWLLLASLVLVLVLRGCSPNAEEVEAERFDTDENEALFRKSSLYALAQNPQRDSMVFASVPVPWLAVRRQVDYESYRRRVLEENLTSWRVIGCSEEELTPEVLRSIRTLILCDPGYHSADYARNGQSVGVGTSEYADVSYFDAATGRYYGKERVEGVELPDSDSYVPHYTLSSGSVLAAIHKRIDSGIWPGHGYQTFEISKNGWLMKAHAMHEDYDTDIAVVPDSVSHITDTAFFYNSFVQVVHIPDTVSFIDDNAFHSQVLLVAPEGSHAEAYAKENGYAYRFEGADMVYLPDGITSIGPYDYHDRKFKRVLVPKTVVSIGQHAFHEKTCLVVAEGSYAQRYAEENGYQYESIK